MVVDLNHIAVTGTGDLVENRIAKATPKSTHEDPKKLATTQTNETSQPTGIPIHTTRKMAKNYR